MANSVKQLPQNASQSVIRHTWKHACDHHNISHTEATERGRQINEADPNRGRRTYYAAFCPELGLIKAHDIENALIQNKPNFKYYVPLSSECYKRIIAEGGTVRKIATHNTKQVVKKTEYWTVEEEEEEEEENLIDLFNDEPPAAAGNNNAQAPFRLADFPNDEPQAQAGAADSAHSDDDSIIDLTADDPNLEQENDTLKQENDTLKQENDTLKQENDTLKQKNDTLKQEHDTLKQENDTLKQENGTLKQKNDTLKQENDTLKQENGTLRNQVKMKDAEIKTVLVENKKKDAQIRYLRKQLAIQNGVIETQILDIREFKEKYQSMESAYNSLSDDMGDMGIRMDDLEGDMNNCHNKVDDNELRSRGRELEAKENYANAHERMDTIATEQTKLQEDMDTKIEEEVNEKVDHKFKTEVKERIEEAVESSTFQREFDKLEGKVDQLDSDHQDTAKLASDVANKQRLQDLEREKENEDRQKFDKNQTALGRYGFTSERNNERYF